MRFPHRLLTLASIAILTGCAGAARPDVPVTPQIVTQTVTRYIAVPEELTAPCPIEKPKQRTVGEAVRVARVRRESLEQCNRQLDAIRSLGEQQ